VYKGDIPRVTLNQAGRSVLTGMLALPSCAGMVSAKVCFDVDGAPDSGWATVLTACAEAAPLLRCAGRVVFAGVCVVDRQHRGTGNRTPYSVPEVTTLTFLLGSNALGS